jgi:hypothetical protein
MKNVKLSNQVTIARIMIYVCSNDCTYVDENMLVSHLDHCHGIRGGGGGLLHAQSVLDKTMSRERQYILVSPCLMSTNNDVGPLICASEILVGFIASYILLPSLANFVTATS